MKIFKKKIMNFDFRDIFRNTTGWICKGDGINYGRKERCYSCSICGIGGEYCVRCAERNNWKCRNGHPLKFQ